MNTKKTISVFWHRLSSKLGVIAAVACLAACASQLPLLTQPQIEWAVRRWPEMTPAQMESARTLYVLKCSGCHTLKLPHAYPIERWPKIMEKMSPKAKLSKEQEVELMRYIVTVVEGPSSP